MVHPRCPGSGGGPTLGLSFNRIGAPRQEEFHQRPLPPPACPSERRAFQQMIPDVEPRTGVEDGGRICDALLRRHVTARDDVVERGETELLIVRRPSTEIGIAAVQQHAEAHQVGVLVPALRRGTEGSVAQRLLEHVEPARIVAPPIHTLQREPQDFGFPATRRAPEQLLA